MKHALVVGGTGMLAKTSLWLLEQGYHVTVLARSERKMNRLIEQTNKVECVTSLLVDYHEEEQLVEAIEQSIDKNGPINLFVSWIHSSAPTALQTISKVVSQKNKDNWHLYHVRSSSSYLSKAPVELPNNCVYHAVYLGFILEGDSSRWLTNDEISSGVIKAIECGGRESIVGIVEPWEKRP